MIEKAWSVVEFPLTIMAKLTKIAVSFISLVDNPANKKAIVWKSEDGPMLLPIVKIDEDKRMVYGLVYTPGEEDTDGDWTDSEEIRKAAYDFITKGINGNVDTDHDFVAGKGKVVESWITKVEGDLVDPLFPDEPEGSWAVGIYVEDDEVWEGVKSGDLNGLSLAGVAAKIKESLVKKFKMKLQEIIKGVKEKFNRNQLNELVWAFQDAIWEVFNDKEIEDKKTAVKDQVTEFSELLDSLILKSQYDPTNKETNPVEKTTTKTEPVTEPVKTEAETVEKTEAQPTGTTAEEIAAIVKTAVSEAVKPLEDRLKSIEESPLQKMSLDVEGGGGDDKPESMFI